MISISKPGIESIGGFAVSGSGFRVRVIDRWCRTSLAPID